MDRPILIFDLDETLIFATAISILKTPAFIFDEYSVYIRPHAHETMESLSRQFDIAIWSSAGDNYVEHVAAQIKPEKVDFAFVWGYSRCTMKYDLELGQYYALKNLKKVKRKGYSLSQMLIVDNTPTKVQANYGNAVYIKDFTGDDSDGELLRLKEYLMKIRSNPNYRRIEKRNW